MNWEALADKALAGEVITREEARAVLRAPDEELLRLIAAAGRVRRAYYGTRVKLNYLLNVKSGLCAEDCHYCSQSKISTADIDKYPLLSGEKIVKAAKRAVSVRRRAFVWWQAGGGQLTGRSGSFPRPSAR